MTWATFITGSSLKIAELYKFVYANGTTEYYTSHDRQLTYGGNDYVPVAIKRGEIQKTVSGNDNRVTIAFPLDSTYIDVSEIVEDKLFDNFELYIYRVNADDTSEAQTLFHGWGEDLSFQEHAVNIAISDVVDKLRLEIPRMSYNWMCSHRLTDRFCTAVLTDYRVQGTAEAGSDDETIVDATLNEADNYWKGGFVEITSGDYDGEKRTIISSDSAGSVTVQIPFSGNIAVGVTFDVYPSCEFKESKCLTDNFMGFKYIKRGIYVHGS